MELAFAIRALSKKLQGLLDLRGIGPIENSRSFQAAVSEVQKRRDFSFASARRRRALPSWSYRSTPVPLSQLRRPLLCFLALRRGVFTEQQGCRITLFVGVQYGRE
jgi:hypothetical protein